MMFEVLIQSNIGGVKSVECENGAVFLFAVFSVLVSIVSMGFFLVS